MSHTHTHIPLGVLHVCPMLLSLGSRAPEDASSLAVWEEFLGLERTVLASACADQGRPYEETGLQLSAGD